MLLLLVGRVNRLEEGRRRRLTRMGMGEGGGGRHGGKGGEGSRKEGRLSTEKGRRRTWGNA